MHGTGAEHSLKEDWNGVIKNHVVLHVHEDGDIFVKSGVDTGRKKAHIGKRGRRIQCTVHTAGLSPLRDYVGAGGMPGPK